MNRDQLIETMARAIYDEHWSKRNSGASRCPWGRLGPGKEPWIREQTAALTAIEAAGMRVVPVEPSEAMKHAGIDVAPMVLRRSQPMGQRRRESWDTDECAEVYRAMVLAAQEDSTSE